jgi:hypothetical protein
MTDKEMQEKFDQLRNVRAAISNIAIWVSNVEEDNRRAMRLIEERVSALQLHFNALEYDLQSGWDDK